MERTTLEIVADGQKDCRAMPLMAISYA